MKPIIERFREWLDPRGIIKAWSLSRLKKYETCAHSLKLEVVDKHKQPPNEHTERGLRMHDICENFIKGERDDLPDISDFFKEKLTALRDHYATGNAVVEDKWAVNVKWEPTGYFDDDAWFRLALDYCGIHNRIAHVVDHKTGKQRNLEHAMQGQLYAIQVFDRYPDVEVVEVEFYYLDHDKISPKRRYTREACELFRESWHQRGFSLTDDTVLRPNPSKWNCKWCHHNETGVCKYAFEE